MIYGDGVGGKYSVIIQGRKRELMAGTANLQEMERRIDLLTEFRGHVQHCKHAEFEELYQLYKDEK